MHGKSGNVREKKARLSHCRSSLDLTDHDQLFILLPARMQTADEWFGEKTPSSPRMGSIVLEKKHWCLWCGHGYSRTGDYSTIWSLAFVQPTVLVTSFCLTHSECATEGWEVVAAGAEKTVKPKARVSAEAIPTITPDYLQKMANHIAFLERQNQG